MKRKNVSFGKGSVGFNIVGYISIAILSLFCIIPFLLVISGSLMDEQAIIRNGFNIVPLPFSLQAYKTLFSFPEDIVSAYQVSIIITVIGTVISLFFTAMTAYVLSRGDFKWRNAVSFFFYFTTLFSGGLVPWYIWCVKYLGLKGAPYAAMILPYLFSVFNLIVMKSFMKSIPESIVESARVDGVNNFTIFMRLILPLSKPALATIGLFIALAYWNDWYLCFMFVENKSFYPLQYFLYTTLSSQDAMKRIAISTGRNLASMPTESLKMAMVVVATGPILFLYPFLQKYFIRGLTIGAVKG
jgi:putative aldouronate transport system permease protein